MAVYWHPFLAEMLRWVLDPRVEVREEVPQGEMPPRLDFLLHRRDPGRELSYPYHLLSETTLMEFKGPDDVADQEALVKLLGDTLAFQRREKIWQRKRLTLWLVASSFAEDVSLPGGAEIVDRTPAGAGLEQGSVDGFPVVLVDLNALDVTPETLPLLMVSKGRQERALVEFLVDHAEEYRVFVQVLPLLHLEVLSEVLMSRQMTAEEIGLERERLIRMYSPEGLAEAMDPEQRARFLRAAVARTIREDEMAKFLGALGDERMAELLRALGPERVHELLGEVPPARPGEA